MCTNRFINNSFNNNTTNSDDRFGTSYGLPANMKYGNSYVPVQVLRTVYLPKEGLSAGSMFPELVSPYYPNQSIDEINYLKNYNERGCN